MADINQVQLPDGSQYNIKDTTSGYATTAYVQDQISAITKATIGLGNVDNTSDANKPVSTAQQTALDGKTNTSVIAYTESSTTATKRYEIGDQFILNGALYTATAIIANGGTITVGTNCSASDSIATQIDTIENAVATKAERADLASISITGTTNNIGATITKGTYFYLNGSLVRAKTVIANGATFTNGTNYEDVTAGALNELANRIVGFIDTTSDVLANIVSYNADWTATADGWCIGFCRKNSAGANNPQVFLDSATMVNGTSTENTVFQFPVKRGQHIKTRNDSGSTYSMTVYQMR